VSDGASQIGECFVSWQLPAALDRYLTVRRLPDRSPQSLHSCHPNLASAVCISRRRAVSAHDNGVGEPSFQWTGIIQPALARARLRIFRSARQARPSERRADDFHLRQLHR